MTKSSKVTMNEVASNSTKRFLIEVTGIRTSKVTDTKSGKIYTCKVEPYHRTDKEGTRFVCRQVKVLGIPNISTKSGVVQVPRIIDEVTKKLKLLVTFTSNLDGKVSTSNFNDEFSN